MANNLDRNFGFLIYTGCGIPFNVLALFTHLQKELAKIPMPDDKGTYVEHLRDAFERVIGEKLTADGTSEMPERLYKQASFGTLDVDHAYWTDKFEKVASKLYPSG